MLLHRACGSVFAHVHDNAQHCGCPSNKTPAPLFFFFLSGLLVSDGAIWRRQRQLTNPAFRTAALNGYIPVCACVMYWWFGGGLLCFCVHRCCVGAY